CRREPSNSRRRFHLPRGGTGGPGRKGPGMSEFGTRKKKNGSGDPFFEGGKQNRSGGSDVETVVLNLFELSLVQIPFTASRVEVEHQVFDVEPQLGEGLLHEGEDPTPALHALARL